MTTIRYTFERVSWRGNQYGPCQDCSRTTRRQKTFSQTLNPFNLNREKGRPKTRREIETEVREQARTWSRLRPVCTSCEIKRLESDG